jgi:transmembrane sensor
MKIEQNNAPDIDSLACDWIARRDRGLSPQESAELLAWLAVDAHARAFAEREGTWKAMELARASLPQAILERDRRFCGFPRRLPPLPPLS